MNAEVSGDPGRATDRPNSPAAGVAQRRRAPGRRRVALAAFVLVIALVLTNIGMILAEPAIQRIASYDGQQSVAKVGWLQAMPHQDVVFMGTSRVLEGLDPDVAKQELAAEGKQPATVYNLGITGGTGGIELNYLVLKNFLVGKYAPSVIVYGISETELNANFAGSAAALPYFQTALRPDDYSLYSGTTIGDKAGFILNQVCIICRDQQLVHDALGIKFDADNQFHVNYAPGPKNAAPPANGFSSNPAHFVGPPAGFALAHKEYQPSVGNFGFGGSRQQLFAAFLTLAKARGIKVILVDMPVSAQFLSWWRTPADIQRYKAEVASLASDANVPLLELYDAGVSILPSDAFIDGHHLNKGGAEIVTRMMTQQFLANDVP